MTSLLKYVLRNAHQLGNICEETVVKLQHENCWAIPILTSALLRGEYITRPNYILKGKGERGLEYGTVYRPPLLCRDAVDDRLSCVMRVACG